MADGKRGPGKGAFVALLVMAVPVAGVVWWLYRPAPEVGPVTPVGDLDAVCLGRVDGLAPVANLEPAVPGRVAEVFVKDGDPVKKGAVLLRLDDAAAVLKLEEANAGVAGVDVEVEAAEQEVKSYPFRVAAATANRNAAGERVKAAEGLLVELKKNQDITKTSAAELFARVAEVEQIRQLKAAADAQLSELAAVNPELRVKAAKAKQASVTVLRKQAQKAVDDCKLVAPSDGTVLRVAAAVGEAVTPGGLSAPVAFLPAGPLVVRAEVDQEFLGRIKPGLKATVTDDVRADSPTWTGKVERVGTWIARKRSLVLEPGEVNDVRTAECVVRLDAPTAGLVVGQRVRVVVSR